MHVLFNKGMGEKEIEPSDQNPGSCHKGFERKKGVDPPVAAVVTCVICFKHLLQHAVGFD